MRFDHMRKNIAKLIGDVAAGKIHSYNAVDNILKGLNTFTDKTSIIIFDKSEADDHLRQIARQFPEVFNKVCKELFIESMEE